MHLIRNIRNSLLLCLLFNSNAFCQNYLEISYNPGFSNIVPGPNARPSLQNAGLNFIFPSEDGNIGFVGGIHLINRGTGARLAVLSQSGNVIEYVRTSTNFYFAHIPAGIWFKHQKFYGMACLSFDRFLSYSYREAGFERPSNRPSWLRNSYLGARFEAGFNRSISSMVDLKLGIYLTNTFAGSTGNPFLNFGLSGGIMFNLGKSEYEEIDDNY